MTKRGLDLFQDKLNYHFSNSDLLQEAFIHSSLINESGNEKLRSNERLEFLGDAVLEIIASDYLFDRFPDDPEGSLSKKRSHAVREESFAAIGRKLDLTSYLLLGHGARLQDAAEKDSIYADCFEALCGAIYRDGGLAFIKDFFYKELDQMDFSDKEVFHIQDPKSELQTLLSRQGKEFEYKLISKKGPDHRPIFEVALYVEGKESTIGYSSSIKRAEAEAARCFLDLEEKSR